MTRVSNDGPKRDCCIPESSWPIHRVTKREKPRMMLPHLSRTSSSMERLDRLSWAAGISFRSHGLRIGVRSGTGMQRGNLAAAVLAGAWRQTQAALRLSADELAEIAPLLLKSGSG